MLPLFVIGAPRSGTNMLRDSICSLPGFYTWPCDELNYMWRHPLPNFPSDALPPDCLDKKSIDYIRSYFYRLSSDSSSFNSSPIIVEKTCANCLRIPFVHKLFPQAYYLYIRRNPVDAIASAMSRWSAPLDIPYILKKLRYVPKRDFLYYGLNYFRNRLHKFFSDDNSLPTWGPVYTGMPFDRSSQSLLYVAAKQWYMCSASAENSLFSDHLINPSQIFSISYEEFVTEPLINLEKLVNFLPISNFNRSEAYSVVNSVAASIYPSSVGNGLEFFTDTDQDFLNSLLSSFTLHDAS